MGIIDDLAMGLGMKARTEDYDARTARTIARNEGADVGQSRAAQQYLGGRGYAEGYRPQVAQDNRPLMQRLLFSQQGAQSPTPYAIGPMQMDQAMPALGPLGLLMRFMSGGEKQEQDPRVASAIADLQNKNKWMAGYGNQGGGVSKESKPTNVADADIVDVQNLDEGLGLLYNTNPMFVNQRNMASWLRPYEGTFVNPDDIKISRIDGTNNPVGKTTYIDAYRALRDRYSDPWDDPRFDAELKLIHSPREPELIKFKEDEYKYLMPPTAAMTEAPAMNFAQYVEAYRKREAPLVASGRLKGPTPLDALRKSYNQFYGLEGY